MMGTEGPEALVAMGEAEVTWEKQKSHANIILLDRYAGVDPGSLRWRQTKDHTGSEWPRMEY